MSIKRKYISVDAQSKESLQEVRLTNQNNVLHGKEIRLLNPESQQMEDVRNIFFSKEDSQQIAESIKKDVKEELKDDYLTVESAESRFISTSQANAFALKSELDELVSKAELQPYLTIESANSNFISKEDAEQFALKSELEGLASEDHVQGAVQAAMQEIENTYLKKEDAQQLATKEELQSTEQSIESSVQQNYLSIEDASTTYLSQTAAASLASKSEVTSAKQEVLGQVDGTYARKEEVQKVVLSGIEDIDLESEYTLTDVAAKINEILAAFRSTSGGNEPAVNPDPGEGGGEEGSGTEGGEGTGGGEGNEPTGGNDEPSSGNEEPSQGETPSQSDPERDPTKTRVIYTEESGIPRSDRDIVGELTSSSIPRITDAKIIDIGNTVTSIGSLAFRSCHGLTSVAIPDSVTSIGYQAFEYCTGLTIVTIPSSVSSIGYRAFNACSKLSGVYINDIAAWCNIAFDYGSYGFSSASYQETNPLYYAHNLYLNNQLVTNLVIPDGVTVIKDKVFRDCHSLQSVVIPASVTSIERWVFEHCENLTTITILGKPTLGAYALSCEAMTTLNVPEFTIDEIQNNAVDWGLIVGQVANCKDGVLTLA